MIDHCAGGLGPEIIAVKRRCFVHLFEALVEVRHRSGKIVRRERNRCVAGGAINFGQRRGGRRDAVGNIEDAMRSRVERGQDRWDRNFGPGRLRDRVQKGRSLRRHCAEVRRGVSRVSVEVQVIAAQCVGDEENNPLRRLHAAKSFSGRSFRARFGANRDDLRAAPKTKRRRLLGDERKPQPCRTAER